MNTIVQVQEIVRALIIIACGVGVWWVFVDTHQKVCEIHKMLSEKQEAE